MGVTTYGWDASELSSSYGLQPFIFDPGEVKTQDELVKEAERKVKEDKLLAKSLKVHKAEITKILQEGLDKVHEQLEQGEDILKTASFPPLNPFDFRDTEGLAKHDFTKDLHADVVDAILRGLVGELLGIVWKNCTVENESKLNALERHNEALAGRMQTLEYHLSDRSRQLSNCRFAYFLEITHLRNQVYIKAKEGEKFEAVEAYFFDPTEFLEEELRVQLNDKINLSVKVYAEKNRELQRLCEDLQMKLETAGEFTRTSQKGKVEELIKPLVTRFGIKKCMDALNLESEREVGEWCSEWAKKHGLKKAVEAAKEEAEQLEAIKAEAKTWEKEAVKLRDALLRGQEELQDEQREHARLQELLDKANMQVEQLDEKLQHALGSTPVKDGSRPASQPAQVVAQSLGDVEQMDSLRKQIARLKIDMEKLSEQKLAAEKKSAEQQAATTAAHESLQRLQDKYDEDMATATAVASSASPEAAQALAAAISAAESQKQAQDAAHPPELQKEDDFYDEELDMFAKDYEASFLALEKMHGRYGRRSEFGRTDSVKSSGRSTVQFGRKESITSVAVSSADEDSDDDDEDDAESEELGIESAPSIRKSTRGSIRSVTRSTIVGRLSRKTLRRGVSKLTFSENDEESNAECIGSEDVQDSGGISAGSGSNAPRRTIAGRATMAQGQLKNLVEMTKDLLEQAHKEKAVLEGSVEELKQKLAEAQATAEEAKAEAEEAKSMSRTGGRRSIGSGSGHSSGRSRGQAGSLSGTGFADAGESEAGSASGSVGPGSPGDGSQDDPTSPTSETAASSRWGSRPLSATKISARVSRNFSSPPTTYVDVAVGDFTISEEFEAPRKELVRGFAESVGTRMQSSTGGFDTQTQTNITGAWDGGFFLLDCPPAEAQVAIEVELEDLNACSIGNWEATLEQIRASQRPPLGHGSGYCPRGAFLRLFQGTRQRIARMEELIQMADKLKRAELLRMLQGVHFLMESTLPDEDVQIRNAIFGRGITESSLVAARPGMECEALSKKWCNHVSKIIHIMLQRPDDVELGVHLGRRTFMVGGGAGGSSRMAGGYGGAGGGLAARERKDFSPPRPPTFPGLLEDDDEEMRELANLSAGGFDPANANMVGLNIASHSSQYPRENLALSGHEIPLFNTQGNSYMMTGFNCVDGPYIMVGGRLVPRGGMNAAPKTGTRGREKSPDPHEGPDLFVSARPWAPDPTECQVRSPPRGAMLRASSRSRSPERRSSSPGEAEASGPSSVLKEGLFRGPQQLPTRQNKGRGLPSLVGRDGLRRGSPNRGPIHSSLDGGSLPGPTTKALSPERSSSTQAEPAAEDDAGYSQILLASSKGKVNALLNNSRFGSRPQTPGDVEEPQAEPAPTLQSPAVSGFSTTAGLRRCVSASAKFSRETQAERDLERDRRQACAGFDPGPTPGWLLDQRAAERLPRGAGGSHTVSMRTDPTRRTTSAGRLRPGDRPGTAPADSSKALLEGVTSRRMAGARANAVSGKKTMCRPGSAVQSRRPSRSTTAAEGAGASDANMLKKPEGWKPAVRITSLPVV